MKRWKLVTYDFIKHSRRKFFILKPYVISLDRSHCPILILNLLTKQHYNDNTGITTSKPQYYNDSITMTPSQWRHHNDGLTMTASQWQHHNDSISMKVTYIHHKHITFISHYPYQNGSCLFHSFKCPLVQFLFFSCHPQDINSFPNFWWTILGNVMTLEYTAKHQLWSVEKK